MTNSKYRVSPGVADTAIGETLASEVFIEGTVFRVRDDRCRYA
jgi:hypothetical protein